MSENSGSGLDWSLPEIEMILKLFDTIEEDPANPLKNYYGAPLLVTSDVDILDDANVLNLLDLNDEELPILMDADLTDLTTVESTSKNNLDTYTENTINEVLATDYFQRHIRENSILHNMEDCHNFPEGQTICQIGTFYGYFLFGLRNNLLISMFQFPHRVYALLDVMGHSSIFEDVVLYYDRQLRHLFWGWSTISAKQGHIHLVFCDINETVKIVDMEHPIYFPVNNPEGGFCYE